MNEEELLREAPRKTKTDTIELILPHLVRVKWFSLHAFLLTKIYSSQKVIEKHLLIDKEVDSIKGISVLVRELKIEDLISFCEKQEEDRIVNALGVACSHDSGLMKKMDQTNSTWRQVWLRSIKITDLPWEGITKPREVMVSILDLLLLKEEIDPELLQYLSLTDFSDLHDYRKRKEVWKILPKTSRNHFLSSTISSLLSKSESDGKTLLNLEDELVQEIDRQVAEEKLLLNQSFSKKLKFQIIENFNVCEALFVLFIKDNVIKFSKEDAVRILKLTLKQKWKKANGVIKSSIYLNRNLKRAVWLEPKGDSQEKTSFIDSLFNMKPTNQKRMEKRKILFMSAGPEDQGYLSLNTEQRKIGEILEAAKNRDQFDLRTRVAVKFETLAKALLEIEPEIIHFSGHGETNGIVLEKEDGTSHFIKKDTIQRIFKISSEHSLKCVLLNSCYSLEQAKELSKLGIAVIGMNDSVSDEMAINFTKGFYTSLGAGKDIKTCFDVGLAYISIDNMEEIDIPELWLNGSLKASN